MADFPKWLEENKLQDYLAALKEDGCDDLEVLTLLGDGQLDELGSRLNMKMGHQLKLKAAVKRARAEMQEQQEQKELARKLTKLKTEKKLNQAKASVKSSLIETNRKLKQAQILAETEPSFEAKEDVKVDDTDDTNLKNDGDLPLPDNKKHHYFASHKVSVLTPVVLSFTHA
jgi:hypothetical protein